MLWTFVYWYKFKIIFVTEYYICFYTYLKNFCILIPILDFFWWKKGFIWILFPGHGPSLRDIMAGTQGRSFHPSAHLCMHASIQPSIHLYIQRSMHSSILPSIYPPFPFINSDIYPFIHPPSHPSIHPPTNSFIYLCLHLFIYPFRHYLFFRSSLILIDKESKFDSVSSSMLWIYSLTSGLIILKENITRSWENKGGILPLELSEGVWFYQPPAILLWDKLNGHVTNRRQAYHHVWHQDNQEYKQKDDLCLGPASKLVSSIFLCFLF